MRDMAGLDEGTPLFAQIAERLAEEIADGGLAEGERVPSMNELAAFYRINPATAAKGLNLLADDGLLEKRRGIGMFVAAGARKRLLAQRRERFAAQLRRAAGDRGRAARHRRRRARRAGQGVRARAPGHARKEVSRYDRRPSRSPA